jgi:hypothetical protein
MMIDDQRKQQPTRSASIQLHPHGVALLMSFPNSGTSYTLHVVRQVSNYTTATNYGEEHIFNGRNILIHNNWTHGPFVSHPEYKLPPAYILTKTHCGGRCVHCPPDRYLELPRSFSRACLESKYYQNHTRYDYHYSKQLVRRVVHLIRNPFDNVVSRFHLSRKHGASSKNFTNNVMGFQEWCRQLDTEYHTYELHVRVFDTDLHHLFRSVPCHVEFYKYVEWHNNAIYTAQSLFGVPIHHIFYDDYKNYWKGTVFGILNFLEIPYDPQQQSTDNIRNVTPFVHRTYVEEYYTAEQRHNIRKLIKELATVETWELLKRYLPAVVKDGGS